MEAGNKDDPAPRASTDRGKKALLILSIIRLLNAAFLVGDAVKLLLKALQVQRQFLHHSLIHANRLDELIENAMAVIYPNGNVEDGPYSNVIWLYCALERIILFATLRSESSWPWK